MSVSARTSIMSNARPSAATRALHAAPIKLAQRKPTEIVDVTLDIHSAQSSTGAAPMVFDAYSPGIALSLVSLITSCAVTGAVIWDIIARMGCVQSTVLSRVQPQPTPVPPYLK